MKHPGLMVIDWSNMCHRAFHAMGGTDNLFAQDVFEYANGMGLNAARSLLMSGAAVVNVQDGGLSGRDLLFPGYKGNRTHREDRPQALTGALGAVHTFKEAPIPYVRAEGFEADDLMANLAWEYINQYPGSPAYILSNDKDLYQIVSPGISILRHKGSDGGLFGMHLVTPEIVLEQYGFEPLKIIDYKALQGDVADCIPSIPRIGHGIACRLVQQWGGAIEAVEAALRNDEAKGFTPKIKQTLIENYQTIVLNKKLIRLQKVPTAKSLLATVLHTESPLP